MIVDDAKVKRAERFGAIVDLGLAAWAARWPLYTAIAALSVGIEFGVSVVTRYDPVALFVSTPIVDGFATALVTLDVFARFSGNVPALRSLAAEALLRWPVVTCTLLVVLCCGFFVVPMVTGSAEDTLYGALILPGLVVMGVLGIVGSIATLERALPPLAVPGYSMLRGMIYAAAWPNLGRLAIAGAIAAVPVMAQLVLEQWLPARGLDSARVLFWANAPVDAICLAPLQAFFTYLYLDFTVREQRR